MLVVSMPGVMFLNCYAVLSVVMLIVITPTVIQLNVIMLSVVFLYCYADCQYAEGHFVQRQYAECHVFKKFYEACRMSFYLMSLY